MNFNSVDTWHTFFSSCFIRYFFGLLFPSFLHSFRSRSLPNCHVVELVVSCSSETSVTVVVCWNCDLLQTFESFVFLFAVALLPRKQRNGSKRLVFGRLFLDVPNQRVFPKRHYIFEAANFVSVYPFMLARPGQSAQFCKTAL